MPKNKQVWEFKNSKMRFNRGWSWLLECILPCVLSFTFFQYLAYSIPTIIVEAAHVKGIDLHTSIDLKIPFIPAFIYFYTPSVFFWAVMPFVIYGVYGRKRFYQYFITNALFSTTCFLTYILLPTEAMLQRQEVLYHGVNKNNTDFTTRIVFATYQMAAPYGEIPSGHWGNSLIFTLVCCKPKYQKEKLNKVQITVLSLWSVFAVLVCLGTFFLKQHNLIDGPVTAVIVFAIWFCVQHTEWAERCNRFFTIINVKLGIEKPTNNINGFQYNDKRRSKYILKIVLAWMLYSFVLLYLLVILYNSTLGGFFNASIPWFVVPHYHRPSYSDNGVPLVDPDGSWKSMY